MFDVYTTVISFDKGAILFLCIYAFGEMFDFSNNNIESIFNCAKLLKLFDFFKAALRQGSQFQQKIPAVSINAKMPKVIIDSPSSTIVSVKRYYRA